MESRILQLIAALRASDVRVSLAESAEAFSAVDLMGIQDREQFRLSLRATLIKDLRTHASEITADWWLGLQPNADIRDFARFRADGTDHFDPRIAREDLRRLRREVAHVKKYVDKHLAHRDQDPTKEIPTFADIHAALDAVAAVFRKYYMLLTGADRFVMVPVPHPGWFRPFTVPWLPPESPSPRLRGTIGSDPL
jgi:uncharacterized protein with von Willebrand factor type A (vWA) domain